MPRVTVILTDDEVAKLKDIAQFNGVMQGDRPAVSTYLAIEIRKLIAREGLIVLGVYAVAYLYDFITVTGTAYDDLFVRAFLSLIGGAIYWPIFYPVVQVIRFIIWAIRMLREK